MSVKLALLVGNSEYEDKTISMLNCPATDVASLAAVLRDPGLGAFDNVEELINCDQSRIKRAISNLFRQGNHDDLLLLYFSGHGLRDDNPGLYLATRDTDRSDLDATAIVSDFIKTVMDKSRCRRQILILDCCHGGAFSAGFKGSGSSGIGVSVNIGEKFDPMGYGRVVLTASDATEFAWEKEIVTGEPHTSLYTTFLVDGLRSGAADLGRDGVITVNELHEYAYRRTIDSSSKQKPTIYSDRGVGTIIISQAPIHAVRLPRPIEAAIESPIASVRAAIIQELVHIFCNDSPGTALSAHRHLACMAQDDSRSVSGSATRALADCEGKRHDISSAILKQIVTDADQPNETSPHTQFLREMQREEETKLASTGNRVHGVKFSSLNRRTSDHLNASVRTEREEKPKPVPKERKSPNSRSPREPKRLAEAERVAEEQRRLAETERVAEEQRRLAETERVAEEQRRLAEARLERESEVRRARVAQEQMRLAQSEEERKGELARQAKLRERKAEAQRKAEVEQQLILAERMREQSLKGDIARSVTNAESLKRIQAARAALPLFLTSIPDESKQAGEQSSIWKPSEWGASEIVIVVIVSIVSAATLIEVITLFVRSFSQ